MSKNNNNNKFEICKNFLDQFNENLSPVYYIQNIMDSQKEMMISSSEKEFISETFFGCCSNKNILDVVINGFYLKDGKNLLQSEKNFFKILAFVIIYQTKINGLEKLKDLSQLWNQEKILIFLKFFLNEKNLLTWIKTSWEKMLDSNYVQNELISPVLSCFDQINNLAKEIELKIYENKPKTSKLITETEPFNFNCKTQKKIFVPEKIIVPEKRNETKLKNLTKTENLENNNIYFKEKKIKVHKLRGQVKYEPENDKETLLDKSFKAKPFNPSVNDSLPIKLNTAVVLKEEFVIKKQTEEALKKFEYLENGSRNSSEFEKWQQNMKINDLTQELELAEKLKLQSKLSYENAKLAKEEMALLNQQRVKKIKELNLKLAKLNNQKKENEKIKNNLLVKEIRENEKAINMVMQELIDAKKQAAQDLKKESELLQNIAFQNVENEMKKKLELIQQIKAAESIPLERKKLVDLTENAGHGLLSEMSIAELNERLVLAKQKNEIHRNKLHDEILKNKNEFDQKIVEKLHFINKFKSSAFMSKKRK